jgi:hypothetical protein
MGYFIRNIRLNQIGIFMPRYPPQVFRFSDTYLWPEFHHSNLLELSGFLTALSLVPVVRIKLKNVGK